MITEDTLFILGAGASYPYGYPTGKELRRIICKEFPEDYRTLLRGGAPPGPDFSENIIRNAEHLARIFLKSSTPSIDLFLARNHDFSEIGRKAIALSIWKAEINSVFREDADQSQDWYSYLYHRMTDKLTDPDSYKQIGENKVSFITFNYDRSLEFFLYESIINSFTSIPRTEPTLGDLLPFSFKHVYCQLAYLPCQDSYSPLNYAKELNISDFNRVWENIRVIYDRTDDNLETIKERISNAKRIFFLGFGFANENLEVLGIPELLKGKQQIYGTTLGWTAKEIDSVRMTLCQNFKGGRPKGANPRIRDTNCYELLREFL